VQDDLVCDVLPSAFRCSGRRRRAARTTASCCCRHCGRDCAKKLKKMKFHHHRRRRRCHHDTTKMLVASKNALLWSTRSIPPVSSSWWRFSQWLFGWLAKKAMIAPFLFLVVRANDEDEIMALMPWVLSVSSDSSVRHSRCHWICWETARRAVYTFGPIPHPFLMKREWRNNVITPPPPTASILDLPGSIVLSVCKPLYGGTMLHQSFHRKHGFDTTNEDEGS
jgi:hypothetical protein